MYVIYYKKAKYLTMDTKKIKALLASVDRGSLTAAAAELGDRVLARHRRAVGVARRHHVIGVGDGDDPGELGDFVAFQVTNA